MYPADNGTFQVKQALCIMQGSLNWCPACCLMMGGKWYMSWCVADFFVRPHGHMVGIVLWQPLIGVHALATLIIATWHFKSYVLDLDVQDWSSHTPLTSCRLKKDTGQHINASMLWRINLWVCGQSTLREHILRSKNINILCENGVLTWTCISLGGACQGQPLSRLGYLDEVTYHVPLTWVGSSVGFIPWMELKLTACSVL